MPTCTAASWCRPTLRARTSVCCSGTRTGIRPRAGTARSRSVRGRSIPDVVAAAADGVTDVTIDVPSGRVVARVLRAGGVDPRDHVSQRAVVRRRARCRCCDFARAVAVDLSWGGALYASVPASRVGLSVSRESYRELIDIGREIKWALNDTELAKHPHDDRLSGVYGTILFDELPDSADGPVQRNVTIYADGAVDRSPCGSGTAARVALLHDDGSLAGGSDADASLVDRHHVRRFGGRGRHGRRTCRRDPRGVRNGVPHRRARVHARRRRSSRDGIRAAVAAPSAHLDAVVARRRSRSQPSCGGCAAATPSAPSASRHSGSSPGLGY